MMIIVLRLTVCLIIGSDDLTPSLCLSAMSTMLLDMCAILDTNVFVIFSKLLKSLTF